MAASCRPWWRNCALEADGEILAIDKMEDHIAPVGANAAKIRELISSLESWLAASLDKTIRLQLNPPAALRAISALAGPDWIKK